MYLTMRIGAPRRRACRADHVHQIATMPDWEVELGIVIGQRTSYLEYPEDAPGAIAGFRVVNDLSERAFQLERTPDEIDDVLSLDMWLDLGLQRQHVLGPR